MNSQQEEKEGCLEGILFIVGFVLVIWWAKWLWSILPL